MSYSSFIQAVYQVRNTLSDEKRKSDPFISQLVFRPLSIWTAGILLVFHVPPNTVTMVSTVFCVLSVVMSLVDASWASYAAIGCLFVFSLLDCVDGNLARAMGQESEAGRWADALSGYVAYSAGLLVAGILAQGDAPDGMADLVLPIIAIAACANLVARLSYQRLVAVGIQSPSNKTGVFRRISSELGIIGWMFPLLLIAQIAEFVWVFVMLYSVMVILAALYAIRGHWRRISMD